MNFNISGKILFGIFCFSFFHPCFLYSQSFEKSLVYGQVIDTIRCDLNPEQTYACYLPTTYEETIGLPIIFIFEPAARGVLPVNLYHRVAEKYGYILVCSNNSKNGPIRDNYIAFEAVYADAEKKIKFDPSRIYTSGFSGGGRFAQNVAFTINGFAGVISVAGPVATGSENPVDSKNIAYVGLVGTKDMNYAEHINYKKHLDKIGVSNTLIISNAVHQWASTEDFERALLWLNMIFTYKHEESKEPVREYIISETERAKKIEELNPLNSLNIYKSLKFNFPSFYKEFNLESRISTLEKYLKKELKEQEKVLQKEMEVQNEFAIRLNELKVSMLNPSLNDSTKSNLAYWRNSINHLHSRQEKDSSDHFPDRQLSFITGQLAIYKNQLATDKYPDYELALNTISLIMYPESIWFNWNQILILYRLGQPKKAVQYLEKLETLDEEKVMYVKNMSQFQKYRIQFPQLFE